MPDDDRRDGLTVRIEQSATTTTIVLGGQLDLASTGALDDAARSLGALTSPLVVDVAGVSFIDSSGLRSLMALHEASIAATGTGARLVNVGPAVHRVLQLTGLVEMFGIDPAPSADG